jgi:hypothetical protein
MGLFSHEDLDSTYKKITDSYIKDLDEEFLAGYKFGKEEYAGSFEDKNWKDDLIKLERSLEKYDRISLIADAKNLGINLGRFHSMLHSSLSVTILNDDKASAILMEIVENLKKIHSFNISIIKNNVSSIKDKKLSSEGVSNKKKILLAIK